MAKLSIRLPIGEFDFRNLRRKGLHFVDKSKFIYDIITASASVILLPRPRWFGKTLNLSMLRYFLEKSAEDRQDLFAGLSIEKSPEAKTHYQKYPVIFLTLKDLKCQNWEECFRGLAIVLSKLYREHQYLLEFGQLTAEEVKVFSSILKETASPEHCSNALFALSKYLYDYHKTPVVILLDEYDTSLHAAYTNGYFRDAITLFRNFLSAAFNDNSYLFKGILTGILRVAKESIFSGLNNLAVHTLLNQTFSTSFGFTEEEVRALTLQMGSPSQMEELRAWYNGYLFGGTTISNPWSILNYLNQPQEGFRPYWVQTSSNDLIRKVLFENQSDQVRGELESLLRGQVVDKPIQDNIVLQEVERDETALWNFLLFSGYLKAQRVYTRESRLYGSLCLPNQEVQLAFEELTQTWFKTQAGSSGVVKQLFDALFQGNAERVESWLGSILEHSTSYHDFGRLMGEQGYHLFMLGMLVNLGYTHVVQSNREAGYGRYDVALIPKQAGQVGVLMEIKTLYDAKITKAKVTAALKQAIEQIRENHYQAAFAEGTEVHAYAMIFAGKRVWVKKLER